uniref:RCC1-like domain-containing protein n=1 Tax=Scylla olivacea TaxID=85551 RepID=A0A0P4WC77_SCYOL
MCGGGRSEGPGKMMSRRSRAPARASVANAVPAKPGRGRGRKRTQTEIPATEPKKVKLQLEVPQVDSGVVLTVGMGDVGQLGLGPDVEEKTRPAVVDLPEGIVAIAAGGLHTVCLDKNGKVHTWGCNDEGALGRNTTCEEDCFISGVVELDAKVVQISAGDCHSAALTETGDVYIWGCFRDNNGPLGLVTEGSGTRTPQQVLAGTPVIKVSSGNNHLALLSQDGQVFTCGCGEIGQLGRIAEVFASRSSRNRNGIQALLDPQPIKVYYRRKAVLFDEVWAGGLGTFVRAKATGDIYGFGLNNYNQMGDDDTNQKFQPVRLKNFAGKTWKQLSIGQHHSLGVTEDGVAHCMGRREYGRLGLGELKEDMKKPTPITSLEEHKAKSVSAGECVSLVVVEGGQVFGFGMGTNNQLAQGDDEDQLVPVPLGGKQLAERNVVAAQAGGQHTVILAVPK